MAVSTRSASGSIRRVDILPTIPRGSDVNAARQPADTCFRAGGSNAASFEVVDDRLVGQLLLEEVFQ
jgi:hypothetical protein